MTGHDFALLGIGAGFGICCFIVWANLRTAWLAGVAKRKGASREK